MRPLTNLSHQSPIQHDVRTPLYWLIFFPILLDKLQKCGAIASLDLVNIIIAMSQAAKVIFWQWDFHRVNPICRFTSCQAMVIFPVF